MFCSLSQILNLYLLRCYKSISFVRSEVGVVQSLLSQQTILAFSKTEKLMEKAQLENLAIQKQSKREKWKKLLSFINVMH